MGRHIGEENYRRLALEIIYQAIKDGDIEFFFSPQFEELVDLLGYSVAGARELAIAKIQARRKRQSVGDGD